MRCPNCQNEVSSSARNCYYCGTAMPSASTHPNTPTPSVESSSSPTAVLNAQHKFVKSPLMLFAILAYSVFAGILLIKTCPLLKYIDECFALIDSSFLLFVTLISSLFIFIGPLIISIGLWRMYSSEGEEGANLVNSGINTHIALNTAMLVGSLLFVLFNGANGYIIAKSIGNLIFPLASGIFGLVAVYCMHSFVDGVEYAAIGGKPNTDGIAKAGTMLLTYFLVLLIGILDIAESMNLGTSLSNMFAESVDSLATIANIAHLLSILLFGIAAHVYRISMIRAEQIDSQAEKHTK